MANAQPESLLARHEFLIRRLHSLTGLLPVGAYMCVHLLVNASILDGPATFQNAVYNIHKLGILLPLVEWTCIFIPILFHGILGVVIIRGGLPNSSAYPYASNYRYTLQRATGIVALIFILWHVFHMHGWFHSQWWIDGIARPLHGAMFKPYSAASTGGAAMQEYWIIPLLYLIGMLACVYHLANGIWTMGITWGIWLTPRAQRGASLVCGVFGVLLALVGIGAVVGFSRVDPQRAAEIETQMYQFQTKAGLIKPNEHKRAGGGGQQAETAAAQHETNVR